MLFNVSINDIDKECTLNKLADDSSAREYVIQRDPEKLKKWAHGNLIQFNKTKNKVLHLG